MYNLISDYTVTYGTFKNNRIVSFLDFVYRKGQDDICSHQTRSMGFQYTKNAWLTCRSPPLGSHYR